MVTFTAVTFGVVLFLHVFAIYDFVNFCSTGFNQFFLLCGFLLLGKNLFGGLLTATFWWTVASARNILWHNRAGGRLLFQSWLFHRHDNRIHIWRPFRALECSEGVLDHGRLNVEFWQLIVINTGWSLFNRIIKLRGWGDNFILEERVRGVFLEEVRVSSKRQRKSVLP